MRSLFLTGYLFAATFALGAQAPTPAETPCTYFPESSLRAAFPIPAGQAMKQGGRRECYWRFTGNFAPGTSPQIRAVTLNFYRGKPRPNLIDRAYKNLSADSTNTVGGKEFTRKARTLEWVSSIGDKAFWNLEDHQLAVSAKNQLFYVTVEAEGMSKAQMQQAAKKVAADVIAKL